VGYKRVFIQCCFAVYYPPMFASKTPRIEEILKDGKAQKNG
jgi:hypothetical protein